MNGEGADVDTELLQQADVILSKCGRPSLQGASAVPLFRCFLMPMVLNPGQTVTFIKEITGETTWLLRAISSSVGSNNAATGVRMQIQLPNGRYLFGGKNGIDVGQFAWIGSWRYLQDPEMKCEPGDKIRVTLSDTGSLADIYQVNLLFEGAYLFYLRGAGHLPSLASRLPRYQGIVNENILAPCYIAGTGPATPLGSEDEAFTYSSDTGTITIGSTLITTTLKIVIDNGLDFHCRRLLFDVQPTGRGVTAGSFLGRVRAGSGYALCDSFMDLARYIGGAEVPKDWVIQGGDEVFIDLNLADATGAGDVSMTVHLEGCRRRKR